MRAERRLMEELDALPGLPDGLYVRLANVAKEMHDMREANRTLHAQVEEQTAQMVELHERGARDLVDYGKLLRVYRGVILKYNDQVLRGLVIKKAHDKSARRERKLRRWLDQQCGVLRSGRMLLRSRRV